MHSSFLCDDTATTEIYTLSLHDALPISGRPAVVPQLPADRQTLPSRAHPLRGREGGRGRHDHLPVREEDRKSTRLNSSHSQISYAVFCLKKKKNHKSARAPCSSRHTIIP